MALALKRCIVDPKLIKPKCIWEVVGFFYFQKLVYKFLQLVYNFSKNYYLPKTFWLFQLRVYNALFQCYSHLLLTVFNRNALRSGVLSYNNLHVRQRCFHKKGIWLLSEVLKSFDHHAIFHVYFVRRRRSKMSRRDYSFKEMLQCDEITMFSL